MIDNSALYKSQQSYKVMQQLYQNNLHRWTVPYESRMVKTRYGATHVLITGAPDAPPLVFFHGWSGNHSGACSELNLPTLSEHFRVYLPETIGQSGRSAPTRLSTKGNGYAEWMLDVFDALEIEQANVSGISGGGYLTLKMSAYAPERVRAALALSTAGIVTMGTFKFILTAVPFLIHPTEAGARRFIRVTTAPGMDATLADEAANMFYMVFKHFNVLREGPAPLTDDELRRITVPLRIVMGAYEVTCNVDKVFTRARRLMPHAELVLAPDAGHMMPGETFSREAIQFFQSNPVLAY